MKLIRSIVQYIRAFFTTQLIAEGYQDETGFNYGKQEPRY